VEWYLYRCSQKKSLNLFELSISNISKLKDKLFGGLEYKLITLPEPEVSHDVPKLIHFMWIFSTISQRYIENVKRFKSLNPTYTVYLWTDCPCPEIEGIEIKQMYSFDFVNKDLLEREKSISKGAAVDMLRYEIVYKYGGIYSDIDSIYTKPLDSYFTKSFVSYIIPKWGNITNALFGFPKESNFLKFVIHCLRENIGLNPNQRDIPVRSGPTFFTTCYLNYNDDKIQAISQEFLLYQNPFGYSYHTNDGSWM
jgi:mannosyltransferase OCH1-like enzyme